MGNLCGKTSGKDIEKVAAHISKKLGHSCQKDGGIRIQARYHRLPVRLEDHYDLGTEVLGYGECGGVKLGTNKATQQRVAVKALSMQGLSSKARKKLVSELDIHLNVDHPNIVTLIDVYESENEIQLVTECMDGGTLCALAKKGKTSEAVAVKMVKQMLLALHYIHSKSIIHRDIKLENFLLEKKGFSDDVGSVKLIDFGVSKYLKPDQIAGTFNSTGTLAYTAPEVLDGWYNSKCDLWGLGVVTFILLVGYMPFFGNTDQMKVMIARGNPMANGPKERWSAISPEAKHFVCKLFVMSPEDRLSTAQALKHPWLSKEDDGQSALTSLDFSTQITPGLQEYAHGSRFRRACMLIMSWSIPVQEQHDIYKVFVELDTKHAGVASTKDLLDRLSLPTNEAEQLRRIGDEFQYSDFLAAIVCTRVVDRQELVQEAFRRFDVAQSGMVGVKELQAILGWSEFDCGAVLDQFEDSSISFDKFNEYLSLNKNAMHLSDGDECPSSPLIMSPTIVKRRRKKSTGVPSDNSAEGSSDGLGQVSI